MILLVAVVFLSGAVVLLGRALVKEQPQSGLDRSLATLERLGFSGSQEMEEEEDQAFADRVLAPLQRRALQIGKRLTGADKAERIRHKLDLAGNPLDWSIDRVVGLKVLAAVLLPLGAIGYGAVVGASLPTLALIAGATSAVGYFAPELYLYQRAYDRSEAIRRTLADSVDLLTISVEAGLGFDAALQQVSRNTDGPLSEELSRVLREMQLGKGRSDSLKALSDRTNVEDLKSFVAAMVQADAFGISIAQVLRVQTAEIRVKRRQYAEAKAQQVPVKIMVPLVVCILPCLMAVIMGPAIISMMKVFS